ncbi:MAG TPA: hypothetical protein VK136_01660 [Bacillota bacterium]|nr:hypothetical protein [Bacillota bacterium]
MTGLLLTVSFLLHIVTLGAIFLLYLKCQQTYKSSDVQQIAELLDLYLEEIKAENRVLKQNLADDDRQLKQASQTLEEENDRTAQVEDEGETMPTENMSDSTETSLQAKILHLHSQGYSSEAIAKKLNCGKTEASLIIKLHAQTNNNA